LSKDEYKKVKEELVLEIQKRIISRFPELEKSIEVLDCWTPLTYERYCNAYHGSYMSFITTPGAKQLRLKGRVKGIDNLYLAGQWTMSPGGLPVAVASGKFAMQRLLKSQKRDINI
jgi:phytoene dehydrogenase-like protein